MPVDDLDEVWTLLSDRLLPLLGSYRRNITGVRRERKHDGTLVSEADVAVQECILSVISAVDPNATVVTEEGTGGAHRCQVGSGRRLWIVDPIDGTTQFLNPSDIEYCVAVAV